MNGNDLEVLFNEGVELYEQENFVEAEQKFLLALKIDPTSDDVKYNLALVYFATGRYDLTLQLIDIIQEIDCSELLAELEKVEGEIPVPLPEIIPEYCEECPFLKLNQLRENKPGHCLFYRIDKLPRESCHAFELVEEGQVTVEEVESRKGNPFQTLLDSFTVKLKDEILPVELACIHCGVEVDLVETERMNKRFDCPKCKKINEIGQQIKDLADIVSREHEEDLFRKLLYPEDYQYAFIQAAKNEILNRRIDLSRSDKFLNMMKSVIKERQSR